MNVKSEVTTTKLKSSSKTLQLSARFSRQIYLVWKKTALTVLLPRISSLTKSSKNTNAFRTWFHNARCSFWSQKKYKKVFCILGNERFGITFFLHRTSITCTLIFLLIFSQRPHNSRTRNHNLLFEKKKAEIAKHYWQLTQLPLSRFGSTKSCENFIPYHDKNCFQIYFRWFSAWFVKPEIRLSKSVKFTNLKTSSFEDDTKQCGMTLIKFFGKALIRHCHDLLDKWPKV